MNLFNFLVWLSAGAVIGWFASQMVTAEHRHTQKLLPDDGPKSELS
jgi:hypothetical protein